jgi:general secretion pathway protein J
LARSRDLDRDAGFSLVETLASLVIVAMIGLMILSGLGTGRRVWEGIDTREANGERIDAAQTALRDRVEEVFPETLYDKSPPYVDFHGFAGRMVFLANPPQAQRPGALRRYTLGLNTRGQLVLLQVSDVAPQGTPPAVQVLLEGVRAFDIAYFGADGPDNVRGWRRQWDGQEALPEVIRIRVGFEPGDARVWPDLLIRPRATIDTECLLNPITHACKGRT